MRIFFTGGSGKAGHHVAPWLAAQGHEVLNADLKPLGAEGVTDLITDLTDPGQVWSAMTSYIGLDEFETGFEIEREQPDSQQRDELFP